MIARSSPAARLTAIWAVLVLATLLVGFLVERHAVSATTAASIGLLVAGVKARWVLLDYMELREAPLPWRILFEAWALLCTTGILAAYWMVR